MKMEVPQPHRLEMRELSGLECLGLLLICFSVRCYTRFTSRILLIREWANDLGMNCKDRYARLGKIRPGLQK